jgi:hypothetical protein
MAGYLQRRTVNGHRCSVPIKKVPVPLGVGVDVDEDLRGVGEGMVEAQEGEPATVQV